MRNSALASDERGTLTVAHLPDQWRNRAAELRRWAAAEGPACALDLAAAELADALRTQADRDYSLTEAAITSGFSVGHLERLIRKGTIPNAGRRGKPRIREGDLPRKVTGVVAGAAGGYPVLTDARDLMSRR